MKNLLKLLAALLISSPLFAQDPNVLLIIADDLGVDYFNGYHQSALMPTTPTLDSLRDQGILFERAWSTPVCTGTRGVIMSGKHGVKTGVLRAPGHLNLSDTSLFSQLSKRLPGKYSGAVVGKWHISNPADAQHPYDHNVDYYTGIMTSGVAAYDNWDLTSYGNTANTTEYATKLITDSAGHWINQQSKPWFMWLAHVAPHSPTHLPPDSMYTISATGTNKRKYIAMIESLDFEINRLLKLIPQSQRDSTTIIFIGDNGTANNMLQNYPDGQAKGTLYEGGIRVPMLVCGNRVTRKGVRDSSLINVLDIHSTVLELAGLDLPGGLYNSLSFKHLLDGSSGATRDYNYSEITDNDVDGWTIRNHRYKLINYASGAQEFFDLYIDSLETVNLNDSLSPELIDVKNELIAEANQRRNDWSCKDHIQNGDEQGIDCGGTHCAPCVTGTNEFDFANGNVRSLEICYW